MNFRIIGLLYLSITAALVVSAVAAQSHTNNARGADLYDNHCQVCHDTQVHVREGRITSIDVLRAWVDAWSVHADLEWTDADTDDVTQYLNSRFYRLPE